MIPRAHLTEWRGYAPWKSNEQVEQDLVISRALVEIFNDPYLSQNLAFRGGTALHKLYLYPQSRYSEDIDFTQVVSSPIKKTIDHLESCLSFLGKPSVKQKQFNNTIVFRYESEYLPVQKMKLKIEINCREHLSVLGHSKLDYSITSSYFSGRAEIVTFLPEELLGTKLRALYQRRKGRDLYDLYKGLTRLDLKTELILECYYNYMKAGNYRLPSKKEFANNLELKIRDNEFRGDTKALLRDEEEFSYEEAFQTVSEKIISKM